MGKRLLNLYVDDEVINYAKLQHINMSALFREIIKGAIRPKEDINREKDIGFLTMEINKARLKITELETKIQKLEDERKSHRRTII